jgi:chitin disaccharide deacetylase
VIWLDERLTNRLLGYPADARLLIINADDFGMCHSVSEAILRTFLDGVVTSTTLMTPCPWAPHAIQLLKEYPDLPFGVHLTLVSDFSNYRWGPLSSRDRVPTLVEESGTFFSYDRIPVLLAGAKLDEVELEFRAQIESVLTEQLSPTHLDWHCLADGGRADISELTLRLATEYGLAMRVHGRPFAERCQREGLPTSDHGVLDSYHLGSIDKPTRYAELLRALPTGLSEWAVHPSLGNAESQALEPSNWQVRKADFDFFTSQEAHDLLAEEGIVLLDYRTLQELWSQ